MVERLTYKEFKSDFLFRLAVLAKADPDIRFETPEVAAKVEGRFPSAWADMAAGDLAHEGRVIFTPMIGASYVSLTGFGLEAAEEHGDLIVYDLWDAIDDYHGAPELVSQTNIQEAEGPVIAIDRMSDVFQGIEADIRETIRIVRSKNDLMGQAEVAQRISELEAANALMMAPQADASLVRRLLLPTLTWLGKKMGDEAAKALIKRLMDEITKWLSAVS